MRRTVFNEDHESFRQMVRDVVASEIVPFFPEWEREGRIPTSAYRALANLGLLGMSVPESYGGGGVSGYKFSAIITEETVAAGVGMGALRVHVDIATPYILHYGTEEQKAQWLPRVVSGEMMLAIAMSEPGIGSDLAGISTTAVRDGDDYIINGTKTFITGALNAGAFLVVARTEKASPDDRRKGLSVILVEADAAGVSVGSNFEKIGLKSQDTAEVALTDVRVPRTHLLGEEGEGFSYLTSNLPQERLSIALSSWVSARTALELTTRQVLDRKAFGRPISEFQNTKFVLAQCATEIEAGQAFIDAALEAHEKGELSAVDAAKLKLYCSELQGRVIDQCLQLFGGYGYMLEYPIARMYADARVTRIYGGTSEIMKTIIAKSLGL